MDILRLNHVERMVQIPSCPTALHDEKPLLDTVTTSCIILHVKNDQLIATRRTRFSRYSMKLYEIPESRRSSLMGMSCWLPQHMPEKNPTFRYPIKDDAISRRQITYMHCVDMHAPYELKNNCRCY